MGKTLNKNGKFGRAKLTDRSSTWKYGKSSGHPDPEVAKAKREKRAKGKK